MNVRKIVKWAAGIGLVGYVVHLVGGVELQRQRLEQNFVRAMTELNQERIKSENFKQLFTSLATYAGDEAVEAWQNAADSDVQFLEIKEAAEAEETPAEEGDVSGGKAEPESVEEA